MSTWKHAERQIAARLGGVRVPVTGRQRGATADVECSGHFDWLALEIKHRKQLPEWMHDAMRQADACAKANQLPMVVYHQKRQEYDESYCMVRLCDFIAWFGAIDSDKL